MTDPNVPLIPRKILFGNPERSSPSISPDGKTLAFLAPDEKDVMQVWVLPRAAELSSAKKLTSDKKRGVRSYGWSEDARTILYAQDSDGDENWHIFAVDLASGVTRDMSPFLGAQASVLRGHREQARTLLLTCNARNHQLHDVYKCDLDSGALELVCENPGDVVGWLADEDLQVRGAQATRGDGGFDIRVREVGGEWRTLLSVGPEDASTGMVGFSGDGRRLFVISCVDADKVRLVEYELSTDRPRTIFEDAESDVEDLFSHRSTKDPIAVSSGRLRTRWTVLDEAYKADFEAIAKLHHGDPAVISRDHDDETWLLAFNTDDGPIPYYLYERASKTARLLFTSRPSLEGQPLAPMEPVEIPTRDGLSLPSYLTRPLKQSGPGPMVLVVHGGPWVRDGWGFDAEAQWLANRGYAVLQVNYRGSTGFGKAFVNAGDREWGAKMHDDLIDAVDWAVSQEIADPKKVAIYGGSYGGYAALVGATFTPDVFCCAVDIVGPSNLITLLNSFPPYWEPLKKLFEKRVGPASDPDFLMSRSPLSKADQIRIPLLVAQGANDPRVKQAEAEQIVEAARKNGKDVDYMLFEDEGHGFARPENRLKFYAAAEAFLARELGGRAES